MHPNQKTGGLAEIAAVASADADVAASIAAYAAAQLVKARAAGSSLAHFPGAVPATLVAAYSVQDRAIALMQDCIVGWKVGRIFPPLSERYGSDRLAGPIFSAGLSFADEKERLAGRVFTGGFGAAEAEFLLRIGRRPDPGKTRYSLGEAAALIDRVHVGIEIASSPLASINDDGPAVIISDFGNNNGLLVGPQIEGWHGTPFADWEVVTRVDGNVVGRGKAGSFPDGPLGAVRFLLELMAARGIPLEAGTWISSGAVSGVHEVRPGQVVEARFGPELKMSCVIEVMAQTG